MVNAVDKGKSYLESGHSSGKETYFDPDFIVDQILSTCGGGRILEVGQGVLVCKLLVRGIDAFGFNIAKTASNSYEKKWGQGRYKSGSLIDISYPDNSFETVCVVDGIECLDEGDIPKVISELYRITNRYVFIQQSVSGRVCSLNRNRNWWETRFFEQGFRKHSLFFEIISYEGLEAESEDILLLFEKIPLEAVDKYPLSTLLEERNLHMDMSRESGRRSEAHCYRYSLVKHYMRNNDVVLDAACGLGYGSAIIWDCAMASKVIGVDESMSAIDYAKANFASTRPGLEFVNGNVTDLSSIKSSSVDLVVSFETIEHVAEIDKMLQEFFRVLIPGGRFVCSVPNLWVDKNGNDPNPFHYHVFDYRKLLSICSRYFMIENIFSQTAGGGFKLGDKPRSVSQLNPLQDHSKVEAEWWLLIGMKDPLLGAKGSYVETALPNDTGKELNVVSFAKDYDNPWVVSPMVHIGWRLKNNQLLIDLAKRVISNSDPASPDMGAAVCILAYRYLEETVPDDNYQAWLIREIRKYISLIENRYDEGTGKVNPHSIRWAISNQYVLAKILQHLGELSSACQEYWKCANMNFMNFGPLLAVKIVDASYNAGWLHLMSNNHMEAKKSWQHGLEMSRIALQGSWDEIVGDFSVPFDFGMHEATQILDLATKCSNGLAYLKHFETRPGKYASLVFFCNDEKLKRMDIRWHHQLEEEKRQMERQMDLQQKQIESLLDTYSWKITAPLRLIGEVFQKK